MITEDVMPLEEMKRVVNQGYLCAKCQSQLNIAWGGYAGINSYILRCGKDINHEGITRHDIKEEKQRREYFSMDSTALTTMTPTEMMKRIEMARFPQDLTVADRKLLAQVAITYGFDPLMGEVTIYQGRPYVSIDGRYRKAQETGQLDGVETRPATKQEREDWQIPIGDYFFRSEVYVKGANRPFVAWGRVHKAETIGGKGYKPVEKNPQRMAEKRAEGQALRKAFHIPLPSVEDIGSPDYDVDSTAIEVDTTTGKIRDTRGEYEKEGRDLLKEVTEKKPEPITKGEYAENPQAGKSAPEPQPEQGVTAPEQAPAPPKPEPSPIDLPWLKEQLEALQGRKITAFSRANFLKYLNGMTGQEAETVTEAVKVLSPEQAAMVTKRINEALDMA